MLFKRGYDGGSAMTHMPVEYDTAFLWAVLAFFIGVFVGMLSPFRLVVV